jgi:hypothetical protein
MSQENFVNTAAELHALRISELNIALVEELKTKFEEVLEGSSTFVARVTAGPFWEGHTYELDLDSMDVKFGFGRVPWVGIEYRMSSGTRQVAGANAALRAILGIP